MATALPAFDKRPPKGDLLKLLTLAGIGRVATAWESVEFEHSRLFSATMGHLDGKVVPFYGEKGRIFKERFRMLKLAVDHHFIVRPHQGLEAWFDQLSDQTPKFADERNNIVHTVVYDLTGHFFLRETPSPQRRNFYAIPPLYALTRRSDVKDGLPFAYTSDTLEVVAKAMFSLQIEWRDFRHSLFPNEWPLEPRAPSTAK